jgi:hypothetical protein
MTLKPPNKAEWKCLLLDIPGISYTLAVVLLPDSPSLLFNEFYLLLIWKLGSHILINPLHLGDVYEQRESGICMRKAGVGPIS